MKKQKDFALSVIVSIVVALLTRKKEALTVYTPSIFITVLAYGIVEKLVDLGLKAAGLM